MLYIYLYNIDCMYKFIIVSITVVCFLTLNIHIYNIIWYNGGRIMLNKFKWVKFSECNLDDPFFDSLKSDYYGFPTWFLNKIEQDAKAFVYFADDKIKAFVYLKKEKEKIDLCDGNLPEEERLKIGTLKLSDDIQGQRLGEGAIGIALWYWQRMQAKQIYVTVFDKHIKLINMFEQFGFVLVGTNVRGEKIYLKDKRNLRYNTPYTSFPYINPEVVHCGYIPINDIFHDTLFPYSELYNTRQETDEIAAANGMTKVFIATPSSKIDYVKGEPVLIFRKYTGIGQAKYKSVITSFCTIIRQTNIKFNGQQIITLNDFKKTTGNKTVYNEGELNKIYEKKNVVVLEMIYNGYFGKGKNITYKTLRENGWFEEHPYINKLSKEQFKRILELGGKNVQDIIVG